MSDVQVAFLDAICATPDDDAPRLVYADWLEEHGESARAEFIRVQVELARLSADDPQRPGLLNREKELRRRHQRAWRRRDVPVWLRKQSRIRGLERGFWRSAEVWFDEDTYPVTGEQIAAVLAIGPFRRLTILGGTRDVAPTIAASTRARSLRSLEFEGDPHGGCFLKPDEVAALANSPNLAGLTELELRIHEFGDEGAAAVAASRHLRALARLALPCDRIRDGGVMALAHSPVLAPLAELDLAYNDFGRDGARALVESPYLDRLRRLRIRLGDRDAETVASLRARFGRRIRILD